MTIRILKKSKPQNERVLDDSKVSKVVKTTISEIENRGDAAIRDLSEKFDNFLPESFLLSRSEISKLVAEVNDKDMADIKFAHNQIRLFAKAQRDSIKDIEIETMPGVILGHKTFPVQSVGCYVPAGKFPMVASAHMLSLIHI